MTHAMSATGELIEILGRYNFALDVVPVGCLCQGAHVANAARSAVPPREGVLRSFHARHGIRFSHDAAEGQHDARR